MTAAAKSNPETIPASPAPPVHYANAIEVAVGTRERAGEAFLTFSVLVPSGPETTEAEIVARIAVPAGAARSLSEALVDALGEDDSREPALLVGGDSVLREIWDNDADAVYDSL